MSIRLWGGGDTSCLWSFQQRGQRGQMADWDSIMNCSHSQWCLWGGSHWLWCGWICPLLAEGVFRSNQWWSTEGHWFWSLWGSVPGTGLEVLSTALDSSSWNLAAMLVWVAVSLGHSVAECREEGSVEALHGAGAMGIWPPSVTLKRSTCNSKGLQAGLQRVSMSQVGGSGSKNCIGSKPPFRPLGYTTWFPHYSSFHTFSRLRWPQVLLLGTPCIIVLMCPSQDRGMCKVS